MEIVVDHNKEKNFVSITNKSDKVLELHLVPKPPKRKVLCSMVIHPNQAYIADVDKNFKVSDFFFRLV